MTEVVLYHHIQGLTEGVRSFADELRQAGHTVHTPDLFDGRTFDTLEDGMAFAREAGFGALAERGVAAAEGLGPGAVYAGFSFGVVAAQQLAQTRPDARGALLMYSCLPASEFGDAWPEGVPVQVHGKEADPFFVEDLDAARALVASTDRAELFLYPGEEHLFADSSLPAYDAAAAALLTERVLTFLDSARVGVEGGRSDRVSWVPLVERVHERPDRQVREERVPHVHVAVDGVAVAASFPGACEVALGDQVGDELLRRSLADADLVGELADPDGRVSGDAEQHVAVVAEEEPVGAVVWHGVTPSKTRF